MVFNRHLIETGCSDKDKAMVINGVYKKLEKWEMLSNKNISEMDKKEIIRLCQEGNNKLFNRSYTSGQVKINAVNYILDWLKMDVKLSMRDFNTKEILKYDNTRYFTREEIKDVCDMFINPQDKFIVYGIFCGLYGKGYKDLLELKVSDIDLENRRINAPSGAVIEMDDYLLDIATDTIDPVWGRTYYKYIDPSNAGSTTDTYELNMDSEYVLKAKPYSKNNNGLDAMKVNGIQRRLNKLAEISEVSLNGVDLLRSGIMDKMYQEELKTGDKWTFASIKTWLKKNGLKGQPFEIYRSYNNKYKDEDLQEQSVN